MCNQNKESFEWVFTKFLDTHGGKKPITIFTDQDSAIGIALEKIIPDTRHALCMWHIGQNCFKKLGKNIKEEKSITGEFNNCVYRYEEEKEFEDAFNILMKKLDGEGKRVLEQNREKEIKSEYRMRSKIPRLKFDMPILHEAEKLYTPKVFELFQAVVELSSSAHKSGQVVWTREDQMILCSCKKFEREDILCWHALKVLVFCKDVKVIPQRYILNRWTKMAKDVVVVDIEGRRVIEDPMLDVRNRNADMVRIITPICGKAAHNEEQTHFVRNGLLELRRKYEEKYENLPQTSGDDNPTSEHSLHLKKKNGGDRRSKRNPSCIEKRTRAKKAKNKTISNGQDSLSGLEITQE
ncbi:hypothetical protein LUZ63_000046 [Rhynchospora breviuscula]|uniref:Protein FAR1-RELATED SEQUENCE n=1 Tax=Rhynchospora breviuscula TaxID=2022672 RepID=A0A9Q0CV29_9POAL|nr:hypothetical protein LUZ63_000046 [Rhynchospora breviuscula]